VAVPSSGNRRPDPQAEAAVWSIEPEENAPKRPGGRRLPYCGETPWASPSGLGSPLSRVIRNM